MSKRLHKDFRSLSWFDLESWAGSRIVSRGRSYQRSKSVRDLAITEFGGLVAWVEGSTTYATKVSFDKGALASVCSCPYYSACKHAVAVILECLDCIEKGKNVPRTGRDDERMVLVESGDELNYKTQIETEKPSALVKTVEREIAKASSDPGWRDHWKNAGYIPDYSRVRSGLRKLLDDGHADEVVRLGEKLFTAGITQIEQSHDEGETADEVADSLKVVFEALGECSLEEVAKMERAVDFGLRDEYDLCHGLEVFWKRRFSRKNWGLLADRLLKRLSDAKYERLEDSYSRNYLRDGLTDEILHALENAERQDEVLSLCRQEAEKTHSYGRLVKHLRKAGHTAEAEEWIRKGIAATSTKLPGIARSLKDELLDLRSLKRDWLFVAALHADDFCEEPGLKTFEDLKKASEKARVWAPVREAMLYFLETGKRPGKSSSDWPLPDTGIETSDSSRHGKAPYTHVLIDIAIHEKRTDDVLKWFEVHKQIRNNWPEDALKDNVANAIAPEYPDKAVVILKELAERHISMTNVSAYGTSAQYLRKAQRILKQNGRETEWNDYLQGLKEANRRKPRCIQILDALSEKPIIRGN